MTIAGDGVIRVQDVPSLAGFSVAGRVDAAIFAGPFGNFGAGLLRVSPDGTRLAIGDNAAFNRMHFVDIASLSPMVTTPTNFVNAPNFEGEWSDNATFFTSGFGAGSLVSRLDVSGSGGGVATTIITGVGQGSGGITVRDGKLFVGDGFNTASGGSPTGNIRAFNLAAMSSASSSVAFTTGTLVADALSAQSLGFDPFGNLLVGGGDFFAGSGDNGYAAVIESAAIADALLGGTPAADADERRLSPAGATSYSLLFNNVTSELLVFAGGTAYRYAVPSPTGASLLVFAGVLSWKRRRA
jgi:hypothetical protein